MHSLLRGIELLNLKLYSDWPFEDPATRGRTRFSMLNRFVIACMKRRTKQLRR